MHMQRAWHVIVNANTTPRFCEGKKSVEKRKEKKIDEKNGPLSLSHTHTAPELRNTQQKQANKQVGNLTLGDAVFSR